VSGDYVVFADGFAGAHKTRVKSRTGHLAWQLVTTGLFSSPTISTAAFGV
jgi:hypothetical protein